MLLYLMACLLLVMSAVALWAQHSGFARPHMAILTMCQRRGADLIRVLNHSSAFCLCGPWADVDQTLIL